MNPFPFIDKNAININVAIATTIARQSPPATIPVLLTALEDNPNPITIIIGPITTGGNNLFNQLTPTYLIINATIT